MSTPVARYNNIIMSILSTNIYKTVANHDMNDDSLYGTDGMKGLRLD
jgi:hypothetical protein